MRFILCACVATGIKQVKITSRYVSCCHNNLYHLLLCQKECVDICIFVVKGTNYPGIFLFVAVL